MHHGFRQFGNIWPDCSSRKRENAEGYFVVVAILRFIGTFRQLWPWLTHGKKKLERPALALFMLPWRTTTKFVAQLSNTWAQIKVWYKQLFSKRYAGKFAFLGKNRPKINRKQALTTIRWTCQSLFFLNPIDCESRPWRVSSEVMQYIYFLFPRLLKYLSLRAIAHISRSTAPIKQDA